MATATQEVAQRGQLDFSRPAGDTLLLQLSGSWNMHGGVPSVSEVEKQIQSGPEVQHLAFEMTRVTGWDSGLLTFLRKVVDQCTAKDIEIDRQGLPDGVRRGSSYSFHGR